jgi:hypothetical protein
MMDAIRYELRGESTPTGLIDELALKHARIGVAGLLKRRGRRARPGQVPSDAAVEGFRWNVLDGWSLRWWPQGVEVLSAGDGEPGGKPVDDGVLVVSWFAQKRRGTSQGARITVVDRRDPLHPTYHHVLLVAPVRAADGSVRLETVHVHSGGLARVGHILYAAATFGGLRSFDLRDILLVNGRGPFGYRCVLPQSGHEKLHGGQGDERMRFSFVSVEHASGGAAGGWSDDDGHLVVGEFGPHPHSRRLGKLPLAGLRADAPTDVVGLREPGIPRMQGAAVIDGTWFVSSSNGLSAGDLWVATDGDWKRHRGVLPVGPEDLAVSADGTRLWSLCEYPRRRWVYAMDAARWRDEPAPGPAATD